MRAVYRLIVAFACLAIGALLADQSAFAASTTYLSDNFSGPLVNAKLWYIPTWISRTDGTYVGRTQFRVTQHSSLPAILDGNVLIPVQTYNPTGFSFYGTELITDQKFALGTGLSITVRARMSTDKYRGVVGGIFLYSLKPGSQTNHDEIDFELLTNLPRHVQTNIYGNEPLGAGHPLFSTYLSGSITDYHTYVIQWRSTSVSWFIDGKLVRTTRENIPAGPMNFYLNDWVPDTTWAQAYSSSIQPTSVAKSNVVLENLEVDWVTIRSLAP